MILNYIPKSPLKAYVGQSLWLPKSLIRVGPIKKALEWVVYNFEGKQTLRLWEETTNHIVCPREFIHPSQYKNYKFPFVNLSPEFEKISFQDFVIPRDKEQEEAYAALSRNANGILNLACGKGKTLLTLKKVAQVGGPTLVVVPDGGILSQWQESIRGDGKKRKPALGFDGEIGLIQGQTFDWKHPITLALVTTLGIRIRDGDVPEEVFRYFKLIVFDEVHQIGAPLFSLTAQPFYGNRIGLTATVQREDGLDPIYRYHIGEPFYSDLRQDLVPRIYFQQTPAVFNTEEAETASGLINISRLRSMAGRDFVANVYRYWHIREALDQGRKILCLSHSKDQLKLFHAMFPDSGLLVSETDRESRMKILRDSQICFAIARLGSTGIDDDKLDTLFWLTPFKSKISLQQSMGRIQRQLPGKKTPVMVIFEDWMTTPMRKLCQSIKGSLRHWGLEITTLKPDVVPTELPPEVKERYDDEFSRLPERITDGSDISGAEGD